MFTPALIVRKTVYANPGLKVNRIIIFFFYTNAFCCFVWDYSKQKVIQYTENVTAKFKTQIKILPLPRLAQLIGLQELRF